MKQLFGIVLIVLLALDSDAHANSNQTTNLEISKAWVRATIGQSNVTAGYLVIENLGDADDALVAVKTPVAAKAEVHQTRMGEGGVMRMRPVPKLPVPAGQTVALKAGADHLMLTGILSPLKAGDFIDLTLTFDRAGDVAVQIPVERRNPYP